MVSPNNGRGQPRIYHTIMFSIAVSSMIEDYQLPAEQVNSKVTIPHLIARHVVSWTHLAPYLGLTEPEIAAISKDGHDELGKQNMMLNDWIRKCGRDATYWHLLEVCLEAEDRELADNICQELQRVSIVTSSPLTTIFFPVLQTTSVMISQDE